MQDKSYSSNVKQLRGRQSEIKKKMQGADRLALGIESIDVEGPNNNDEE